jgi:TatD DNase family protein
MTAAALTPPRAPVIGYPWYDGFYLNVTPRCTLRCTFCPKFNGSWEMHGRDLRLESEPTAEEIVRAVGDPRPYAEIVFCGLGEPSLRLYTCLKAASQLRARGAARIRMVTDGLANLAYGRDVTPDFEGIVDALDISLNAQDEATYERHCRPSRPGAYAAMLDFVRRVREFVPQVTLTAVAGLAGVDLARCAAIAAELGVGFRARAFGDLG